METILCAHRLYTGQGPVLEDQAIYIKGGLIQDVGPREALFARYPNVHPTGKDGWLVTPAFIDAHDHGRGVSPAAFGARDQALELWLLSLGGVYAPAYAAALYDGLLLATSGVSTVLHSHNPTSWDAMEEDLVDVARGYGDAGVRVVLCPPYVDQNHLLYCDRQDFADSLPPTLEREFLDLICDCPCSLEQYFALLESLQRRLALQIKTGMVRLQLHPAGFQWCSDETLTRMQEYAQARDLRIHMHMLETQYQLQYARRRWGNSGVSHLHRLGLLTPRLSLAHMVWADCEDYSLLARQGVQVVTNPSSNLRLRSGVMPLQTAVEAGVTCAVGLDGCGLDDDQDYLRELRLAACNPARWGVGAGVDSRTILHMAACGGGKVTGNGGGSLRPGAAADLVCFDERRLRLPYAASDVDPLDLLLLRGSRAMVDRVYVNGTCVVRNGQPAGNRSLSQAAEQLGMEIAAQIKSRGAVVPISSALQQAVGGFYAQSQPTGGKPT